ncbi:hypothetical protein ACPCVL_15785 [Streptomyces koyangensis]|uniref:hypothetical protein n=1 Tax=Streptomyces koyangensis TaxID=188770 RepID=UPI003C2F27A6
MLQRLLEPQRNMGGFCIAAAHTEPGIISGAIIRLIIRGGLPQHFTVQELHESLDISCDHLHPRLGRLIDIPDERSAVQPNDLSGLTISSKQCAATVGAKHDDSPIGHATYLGWLSATQSLNHTLGLINEKSWTDIRQGNLRYAGIEIDQISRDCATQCRSECIATATVGDS